MATALFMQLVGYLSRAYGRSAHPDSQGRLRFQGTFSDSNGHSGTVDATRVSGPPADGGCSASTVRPTGTSVSCNFIVATGSDTCTATVGDGAASPRLTPTGSVTFRTVNGGVFSVGRTCGLSATPLSPGVASCSVELIPPANGAFPQIGARAGSRGWRRR